ncbi:MAG TPA: PepSY domain-containing protein [Luteimonas sp.]
MKHSNVQAIALAVALATAGSAAAQQATTAADTMTAPQVRDSLESQGYTDVNDVEFEDGLWKADARSADGARVEVRIDPASGKVYPDNAVATLGEADIRARLTAAGYLKIHDVEFDDGLWTADAEDAGGRDLKLTLDPETGEVIGKDRD